MLLGIISAMSHISVQDVAEKIRASMSDMEGSTYVRRDGEPIDSLLNCDSFAEEEAKREQAIREIFTIPFQVDSQIIITRRDLPADTYYNSDGTVIWSVEPTSEYTIEMTLPDNMVDHAVESIAQYMTENDMEIYADDPLTADGIVYLVIENEDYWHLVPVFANAFIAFARKV